MMKMFQGESRSAYAKRMGFGKWMVGKKHSLETKKLMSEKRKGVKRGSFSKEWRENLSKSHKGKCSELQLFKNRSRKGVQHSVEHRMKISVALTGLKRSEEFKKKMKGRVFSEVHRENLSISQMGNKKNLGKHLSEETKRKISESHEGRHYVVSPNFRRKTAVSEEERGRRAISMGKVIVGGGGRRLRVALEYKGVFFRNARERDFAKWLDGEGIFWEYESSYFVCASGKVYVPDFYLEDYDLWVEVKSSGCPMCSRRKMDEFVKKGFRLVVVDDESDFTLKKEWGEGKS